MTLSESLKCLSTEFLDCFVSLEENGLAMVFEYVVGTSSISAIPFTVFSKDVESGCQELIQ